MATGLTENNNRLSGNRADKEIHTTTERDFAATVTHTRTSKKPTSLANMESTSQLEATMATY